MALTANFVPYISNTNGVPDDCDIQNGPSHDYNGNGVPDECEQCGDITGDGLVNADDYWAYVDAFGWTSVTSSFENRYPRYPVT